MLLKSEQAAQNPYPLDRVFISALILSLACHILCFGLWQSYFKYSSGVETRAQASNLSVTLHSSRPQAITVPEVLSKIVKTSQTKVARTPQEPSLPKSRSKETEPRRTSTTLIIGNISEIIRPLAAKRPDSFTVNGAVVMDKSLRKVLNNAKRKSGYTPPRGGFRKDSILTAGTGDWTDFVDTGGNCYYIERASPVRPGSRDVWFRIKCE